MITGPLASHLIMRIQTRGSHELRLRLTRSAVATIRSAAPLGVAVVATQIYYGADSILLGLLRTPTDVGLYGAAYRIVIACLVIPVAAHGVALTMFSGAPTSEGQDPGGLRRSITRWLIVVSLPLAVGTTLCAAMIVRVVFGPAFAGSAIPLAILIWSTVTVSANAAFGAWMLSQGQDKRYLRVTLSACVANVVVNLVAIPAFGILGASFTTMMTEVLVLILIIRATSVGATRAIVAALRSAIVPTVAMAIVVLPLRDLPIAIPVGAAVYLGVGILTGTFPIAPVRRMIVARTQRR
jgi:O-antigen/teichoic acid export membrane protein